MDRPQQRGHADRLAEVMVRAGLLRRLDLVRRVWALTTMTGVRGAWRLASTARISRVA
jgi:hypothetical protein